MRLLLAAFAWTILLIADIGAASAQEPGRVYKVGWLQVGTPGLGQHPMEQWTGPASAFRDALRDSGYTSGKNLVVEMRNAQGDVTRLAAEADALVASKVDVIVSLGTPATVAAMNATKTIPIVFPGVGLPIEKGIVASLAKPGGNVTGMAVNVEFPKVWQLLRDVSPGVRRAGKLVHGRNNYANAKAPDFLTSALVTRRREAAAVGIEMVEMIVNTPDDLAPKFAELASGGGTAITISSDATLLSWRLSILELASRHRLVTACSQEREWAQAGCVLTFGEDPYDRFRRAAAQVVKVLRGTRPADIPVEQPTKFLLTINAKAAKALDLTLPPSLLALADEVIE